MTRIQLFQAFAVLFTCYQIHTCGAQFSFATSSASAGGAVATAGGVTAIAQLPGFGFNFGFNSFPLQQNGFFGNSNYNYEQSWQGGSTWGQPGPRPGMRRPPPPPPPPPPRQPPMPWGPWNRGNGWNNEGGRQPNPSWDSRQPTPGRGNNNNGRQPPYPPNSGRPTPHFPDIQQPPVTQPKPNPKPNPPIITQPTRAPTPIDVAPTENTPISGTNRPPLIIAPTPPPRTDDTSITGKNPPPLFPPQPSPTVRSPELSELRLIMYPSKQEAASADPAPLIDIRRR
ncbi:proline-rich protein 2 [Drosophila busckii]|uniref:proline-rich protein 2 n=1 Tax=Drosophila busckii TaxID=30019 RepID=UPI00083F26BE|nr:proline-rich protein 2 [Drosophila busckii]